MSQNPPANPGNLLVVAGAGTGKTYKLVQTCVSRLRDPAAGINIDEILIVTFTKAAAAELRRRIGEALHEAFKLDPNSAHLARQIALLDRAQISTLHSFCLELVSRHFNELGLSPRLSTLEAAQAVMVEMEALETLFERYYEAENQDAKAARQLLMAWFKGDDRAARRLVRALHAFTQTRPNPAHWFARQQALLAGSEPAHWREWHERAVAEWLRRWRPLVQEQADEKNPARAQILALMDKWNLGAIADLWDAGDETWPRGSKKYFRDPLKKMFEGARELAAWTGDALLEDWNLTRESSLTLLKIAEDFSNEFAELKRVRGFVDFHDLEQFSLQLLWNGDLTQPAPVAEYWREHFKCVFVDEYQDINQAQDKIIEALARPQENGNRFLVGDIKQSIYGFRQAEPEIFQNYRKRWERNDGGACEFLSRNWRSHERILDFINALFASIMSESLGGVNYDENARLLFAEHPDRIPMSAKSDSAPKVEVHMVSPAIEADHEDEPNALAELKNAEAEAEVIAGLCQQLVQSGNGYGDIVILMRSAATEVEAFAKVFSRRGIPFDARRTGFFNCIEVLDLLNLLTILDNPLQDIPLLGVLRSPLGCFSLEELSQARIGLPKGAFWEALQRFDHPKGADFLAKFQKWRELSRHTSLAHRLEIILEETGYEDWVAAQERGPQRRANVRRLVELARQFDQAQGEGLYLFLQYVEEQTQAVGDIAPAALESNGAVRLMTVHQSKGLQFPIVIMAGLNKKFNRQDFRGLALLDDEFGACLKARPPGTRRQYETLPFWMARHRQEKKLLDEEMRILYVALTRAEHQLFLVGTPSKKAREHWRNGGKRPDAANSMLDWIAPFLTRSAPQWLEDDEGAARDWKWRWHGALDKQLEFQLSPTEISLTGNQLSALKSRLEWQYPFFSTTIQEAKSSATALRRALPDEPELARPIFKTPRPKKETLSGNQLGQVAHRFMQHARFEAFQNADALAEELSRLTQTAILKTEECHAIDSSKILAFWQSDFGKELLQRANSLQRELAFTAKFTEADLRAVGAPIQNNFGAEEFIVVQGAADLVAILDDELWLIDFKTDRLRAELLGSRLKEYSLQLRIYALALSRIYRRPVTRACLHFLESGRTEWIEL